MFLQEDCKKTDGIISKYGSYSCNGGTKDCVYFLGGKKGKMPTLSCSEPKATNDADKADIWGYNPGITDR